MKSLIYLWNHRQLLLPHLYLSSPVNHFFFQSPQSCFSPLSPSISPLFSVYRRLTKNESFFLVPEEQFSTHQNKIKNAGENWKRKDVHEILRANAEALCNKQSVIVNLLKRVLKPEHKFPMPTFIRFKCLHEDMSGKEDHSCQGVPILSWWALVSLRIPVVSLVFIRLFFFLYLPRSCF